MSNTKFDFRAANKTELEGRIEAWGAKLAQVDREENPDALSGKQINNLRACVQFARSEIARRFGGAS